ncbi:MAG: ATP-dependent DNA helicase RecG [Kiritimatiellia bacterium]|jgi:ATP-dependent DNA helicase RecG
MSDMGEAQTGSSVDLPLLDAAMSPLRRVVRFAMLSDQARESARYVGAIGGRWAARAQAAAAGQLPTVFDQLVELLAGLDALEGEPSSQQLADVAAVIGTIDRVLGLPLGLPVGRTTQQSTGRKRNRGKGSSGRRGGQAAEASAPSKEKSRGGRSRKARPNKKAKQSGPVKEVAEPVSASDVRWSGPSIHGRSIDDLHGSAQTIAALEEAGVLTVGQLLCLPVKGERLVTPILGSGRVKVDGETAVGGRVKCRYDKIGGGSRETVVVLVGSGLTEARWPGGAPAWLIDELAPGRRTVLTGHAAVSEKGTTVLASPELSSDDGKHAVRLTSYEVPGTSEGEVRSLIRQALVDASEVAEPLPASMVAEHDLLPLSEALTQYHLHGSRAKAAIRRLKFDEALLAQLAMMWSRYGVNKDRGIPHALLHGMAARFLQLVEDELIDEQQHALEAIKRDLRSNSPMRRVLTGEVGSGKGLVAILTVVMVAENKSQAMVLSPNAATAEQRFAFTQPLLRDLGLVAKLYTETPSRSERDAVRRGEVHVIFGPTSLLSEDIEFRRLGLVIAGERDTFGAVGNMHASLRAPLPDLLVVTSTPVPYQVLLAAYPAFDVTVMRRGFSRPAPCTVIDASEREVAYQAAAEAVERHEQVVVVFPVRDGVDVLDAREAMRVVAALEGRVLSGANIRLFHGSMSRTERSRVFDDFRRHRADVLVATTHFEAGPSIDSVTTIIVEQADRMRPSRLHRVRGFISGPAEKTHCYLVTGELPDALGVDLVRRIANSKDGFSVSAQELEDRGLEGMVVEGTKPGPRMSTIDPVSDLQLLVTTRGAARQILQQDAGLRRGGNNLLARYLQSRWSEFYDDECPLQAGSAGGRRRRRRRKR